MTTKKPRRFKVEFEITTDDNTNVADISISRKPPMSQSSLIRVKTYDGEGHFCDLNNIHIARLLPSKRKYYLIRIHEQNGEQEYTFEHLADLHPRANVEKYADNVAKTWYDDDAEKEGDGYYHVGGEIYVEVKSITEITQEEYNVLKKYL